MAKKKGTNTGIPGLSFSLKRALGITTLKRKIAKTTGIPTTKAGRQKKIGSLLTGNGCLFPLLLIIISIYLIINVLGV